MVNSLNGTSACLHFVYVNTQLPASQTSGSNIYKTECFKANFSLKADLFAMQRHYVIISLCL